jgi:hypothetical protein
MPSQLSNLLHAAKFQVLIIVMPDVVLCHCIDSLARPPGGAGVAGAAGRDFCSHDHGSGGRCHSGEWSLSWWWSESSSGVKSMMISLASCTIVLLP